MSSVDQRVVQMKFDNSKFEQKAQSMLSTLDKLKEKLSFKNAGDGFSNIEQAANRIDLSGIATAAERVNDRFSAMGTFTSRIIENIADSAYAAGQKIASYIAAPVTNAVNKIKTGGWNRAANLEQAKFTMEGLGKSWDQYGDEIQESVNDTSYSLDQAALAASKFLSSGVDKEDELFGILKATAGTASVFGASYDQVADIFQDCISKGVAMGDEFSRLEAIGVPAAQLLADEWGVTAAEIKDMASKRQIDALALVGVLLKNFGDQAAKANDTYDGALANLGSALSRIGENVATPLRGHLRDVYNALRGILNGVNVALDPVYKVINSKIGDAAERVLKLLGGSDAAELKKIWSEKLAVVFEHISTGLNNLWAVAERVITPIALAFKQVFPPATQKSMENASKSFADFTASLIPSKEKMEAIATVAVKLFTIIKDIGTLVGGAIGWIGKTISLMGAASDPVEVLAARLSQATGLNFSALNGGLHALASVLGVVGGIIKSVAGWIVTTIHLMANSEAPIKTLVARISELIGLNLSSIADFFGSIAENVGTLFKNLTGGADLSIFDNLKDKAKELKENLDFSNIQFDPLAGIKAAFEKAKEGLSNFKPIEDIKEAFKKAFGKLGSAIAKMFGGLKDRLKGLKLDDIFKLLSSGMIVKILFNLKEMTKNFRNFSAAFSDPLTKLTTVFTSLKIKLRNARTTIGAEWNAFKKVLDIRNLLKIAVAIGILAASVAILGNMDPERLAMGVVAIAAIFKGLEKALDNVTKLQEKGAKFGKIAVGMLLISVAVLVLASAVKKLGSLDLGSLATGLLGLAAILLMTVKATKYLSDNVNGVIKGAGAMIAFAIAVRILTSSVVKLATLDIGQLLTGLVGLFGILAGIGVFVTALDSKKGLSLKLAASLLLMAVAVRILAGAVLKMATLSWSELAKGLVGVAGILAGLVLFLSFSSTPENMLKTAAGMLIMAAAIKMISKVVTVFAKTKNLTKGLIGFGVILGGLAVGLNLMKGTLLGAAAMVVAAAAVLLLVPALLALSMLKPEQMLVGLVALAGAFLILGVAGLALSTIALPMMAAAAAVAALGAAVLVAGVGALAFGAGLGALAIAIKAVIDAIVGGTVDIVEALPKAIEALLGAATALLVGLKEAGVALVELIGAIGLSVLEAIIQLTPKLCDTVVTILATLAGVIVNNLHPFIVCAVKIIIAFINGLAESMGLIVQAGIDLVVAFVNGIAQGIRENTAAIWAAVRNLVSSLVEFVIMTLGDLLNHIPVVGKDLHDAMYDAAKGVQGFLAPESLRDETEAAMDGGAKGIADGKSAVVEESGKVGSEATSKLAEELGFGGVLSDETLGALDDLAGTDVTAKIDEVTGGLTSKITSGVDTDAIGETWDSTLGGSITDNASIPTDAVDDLIEDMDLDMTSFAEGGSDYGSGFVDYVGDGLIEESGTVGDAMSVVTATAEQPLADLSTDTEIAGKNATIGFVDGVLSKLPDVQAAMQTLGFWAKEYLRRELDEHSPSKEFATIGVFGGEGLANGFLNSIGTVEAAASQVGTSALDSVKKSLAAIPAALVNMDEFNPTITPIMDLSNIQNGANAIDGMFTDSTISVGSVRGDMFSSNLGNLAALADSLSLGRGSGSDDVVSAIERLQDEVATMGEKMSKLQVRMDSGALVGQIAAPLDASLGRIARRRERSG